MDKFYYSYGLMQDYLESIKEPLLENDFDFIVGLSRGGLVPAVYISHLLDKPLKTMDYSSKSGNGSGNHLNDIPWWFLDSKSKFLLVDDIADTGKTLKELMTIASFNVFSLTLTYKEHTCYYPTFSGMRVPSEAWVVFPWEKS